MAANDFLRERNKALTKLEKEIERKLCERVKRLGGLCLKWVCPGWAGVPDRIILMPGGRVYFAELKRPKGGTISPPQRWWADKLRSIGFWSVFIQTEAELDAFELILIEEKRR